MEKVIFTLSFLAILVCAAQGNIDCDMRNVGKDYGDRLGNASMTCLTSLNLNKRELFANEDEWMSEDYDDKCFSKCFAKELKWINDKGQVNKEAVLILISEAPAPAKEALTLEINACYTKIEKELESTEDAVLCKAFQKGRACFAKGLNKVCYGH